MAPLSADVAPSAQGRRGAHAPYGRLLVDQLSHDLRELWRSRIAFVFTFMFPMTWLVVLGLVIGSDTVDQGTGVPIMQFLTPTAAAMGVLFSAFPTVATSLATAREDSVLKRIHGTPLPTWVFVAGRVCAAVVVAFASFAAMVAVGVVFYGVDLQGRTALATIVTVAAATASFAAAGMAVATLSSSAATAQAASIAATVAIAFVSGLMGFGDMPAWADRVASVFPVKPFNDALGDQFNPFSTGAGWDLGALAVVAAWGIAAAVVVVRAFRWEPAVKRSSWRGTARAAAKPLPPSAGTRTMRATCTGRRRAGSQLWAQSRWATRGTLRDPGSMFFAVLMPLTLFAFMMSVYDRQSTGPAGEPIDVYTLGGLTAWTAAVVGFVYLPEAIVAARESGVLKRLRGTPLTPSFYLAGRAASSLWIALVTGALLVVEALLIFDVDLAMPGLVTATALLLLGTSSIIACGFVLVSLAPSSKAASAAGLGILFPVSFVSNVFVAGDMPRWLDTVGSLLPLKHLAHSLVTALDPAGSSVDWTGAAVMSGWLVAASLLAVRLFSWQPRRG